MIYAPATLVWVQPTDTVSTQFRLVSPEWIRWSFAQVTQHPDGLWSSRVGLHRPDHPLCSADAVTARAGMRWAERWVRARWDRIEAEMIRQGNSSAYRTVDYRVFAGRGLAPPQ